MKLNRFIDHTLLKPDATRGQVKKLCEEAAKYNFKSVCVNSSNAQYAAEFLHGTDVDVCCVVGFPLGASLSDVKAYEARRCIELGAKEIDMVINIGRAKDGDWEYVENDIRAVVTAASGHALVKVIIETCLLTDEEKIKACECAERAGADFVKTSTGFSNGGATCADVALMRGAVGDRLGVKASGGIRTRDDAEAMISAGASRIGASASVSIVKDE